MAKATGFYPPLTVDSTAQRVVSHAGGVLLAAAVGQTGLGRALSAGLARWRRPLAVHDPGKIVADLAVSLGLGGDCLADIGQLRAEPAVFGSVASDPRRVSAGRQVGCRRRRGRESDRDCPGAGPRPGVGGGRFGRAELRGQSH